MKENFDIAYEKIMHHEGGYINDIDDYGGETYKGISRRYHPKWSGWTIIDQMKKHKNFPYNLKDSNILNSMVKDFYKEKYWDQFLGDDIKSKNISIELFDISVNMGVNRAVKFLQKSLNLLNRNQTFFDDLVEDGIMGKNTITALNTYLWNDEEHYLLKLINIFQGNHYIEFMTKNPKQEKYARGWLNRIEIYKK